MFVFFFFYYSGTFLVHLLILVALPVLKAIYSMVVSLIQLDLNMKMLFFYDIFVHKHTHTIWIFSTFFTFHSYNAHTFSHSVFDMKIDLTFMGEKEKK